MIDAKELRIGNKIYVYDHKNISTIIGLDIVAKVEFSSGGNDGFTYDALTPIPLTPEIWKNIKLVSFDFAENFSCYIEYDGTVLIEQYHEGQEELKHIKYLHQLQNLCFALTGKELEINL